MKTSHNQEIPHLYAISFKKEQTDKINTIFGTKFDPHFLEKIKNSSATANQTLLYIVILAPRVGLEPTTYRLTAQSYLSIL